MAGKAQAEARARELGCVLVDDGDCVTVDAPAGRVLGGCGQHFIEHGYGGFDAIRKAEVWEWVTEDMGAKTRLCESATVNGGPGCCVCDETPVQEGVGA